MDNAAHTPGPWRADGCEIIGDSRVVATVCWCSGMEIEDQANIRLIAVAPDMLATLKSLVADILEYERINNLAPNPGRQDCWQSVTNARAIIAKAQGATP